MTFVIEKFWHFLNKTGCFPFLSALQTHHIDGIVQSLWGDGLADGGTELLQQHHRLQALSCAVSYDPAAVTGTEGETSLTNTSRVQKKCMAPGKQLHSSQKTFLNFSRSVSRVLPCSSVCSTSDTREDSRVSVKYVKKKKLVSFYEVLCSSDCAVLILITWMTYSLDSTGHSSVMSQVRRCLTRGFTPYAWFYCLPRFFICLSFHLCRFLQWNRVQSLHRATYFEKKEIIGSDFLPDSK